MMPKPTLVYQPSFYASNTIWAIAYAIDLCNYNCPYCYNKKPRDGKQIDFSQLESFLQTVSKASGKRVRLELIGGEPTLHPHLVEFAKHATQQSWLEKLLVFTNLSQSIPLYRELLEARCHLLASWHSQSKDYTSKVLALMPDWSSQISLCIMAEPDNWEEMRDNVFNKIANAFPDKLGSFDPSLIAETEQFKPHYTQQQLAWFYSTIQKLHPFQEKFEVHFDDGSVQSKTFGQMFLDDTYSFKHWKCDAGLVHLYVHSDGNVFKCQSCYDTRDKPIGHISCPNAVQLKPTFCKFETCSCTYCVKKEALLRR